MNDEVIPVSRPSIGETEIGYVSDAVRSGWVSSLGRYIDIFEERFAAYIGVKHAVATSNGTSGLHLALSALGIGPGDEVIVPDLTFVATANAVTYTGAKPIAVDVDALTLCLDPSSAAAAITSRTRAIIPVHLYGQPADMDSINELASKSGLFVVEDAAEAHGSEYKGKPVGGLGTCGVFSFYGNKIITCGEGGILTTNDSKLYNRARLLRDHAMSVDRRYWHAEVGFNYRMTNLQAALGVAQLERIEEFIAYRSRVLHTYQEFIKTSSSVRLNRPSPWGRVALWMVCLEVDWFDEGLRSGFMQALRARGVDTRPYFNPLTALPMYLGNPNPVTHRKSAIGVNLPTFVGLTDAQIQRIAEAVNDTLASLEPSHNVDQQRLNLSQ